MLRLPATVSQDELLATIDRLNADPAVHGILVQMPLPRQIDERAVIERVTPLKDVDGFHPVNFGLLAQGNPRFVPCTPLGIRELLLHGGVETRGAHAVVLGRSQLVGKPMAMLLMQKGPAADATVTVCHTATRDPASFARQADILVVAMGRPELVTADWIKPGVVVIDVGIHKRPRRHPLRRRRLRRCLAGRLEDHARPRRRRADDRRHAAAEHAQRGSRLNGDTAMIKLGICNELFEGWEFDQVCRTVKLVGYDGLEIAPFTLAPRIDALGVARRRELKAMVEDAGLETIGLHWLLARTEGFYLTSPDASVRRATGDYLKALAEATRDLGGSLMVLGSPKQRDLLPGVTHDQAAGYAMEVFHDLLPVLDACEVDLCLEPLAPSETNFLNTCEQAMDLIRRVGHPRVKLHMDVKAQSGETGTTVPALIRRYSSEAGHFHAQDVNLRGPGMGDVDYGPILDALVETGYDRWVSVEVFDFSPGAEETARRSFECLKRLRTCSPASGHLR